MAGLIRCDIEGCESLVQPHLARCRECRSEHGPSTRAYRPDASPSRALPAGRSTPKQHRHPCPGLRGLRCGELIAARFELCKRCEQARKVRKREAAAGIPSHARPPRKQANRSVIPERGGGYPEAPDRGPGRASLAENATDPRDGI